MKNHKIMRRSFEFSFIMENPIPAPNLIEMEMGKKSPRLLNGNGDEMALSGEEQTRCQLLATKTMFRSRAIRIACCVHCNSGVQHMLIDQSAMHGFLLACTNSTCLINSAN
jgi:hypothetical protein